MSTRAIYVVIDHKAQDIVGYLNVFRAEAAAVRFFHDVATQPGSMLGKYPDDYALVRLGYLNDDLTVTPDNKTILEGSAWWAAHNAAQTKETNS